MVGGIDELYRTILFSHSDILAVDVPKSVTNMRTRLSAEGITTRTRLSAEGITTRTAAYTFHEERIRPHIHKKRTISK
ncbi:hypothetical protein VNO77_01741 [Canavalia gladiata]|uniref:Uncharacterized protein n=1 Tax=Canavalia gladiata TaxID=3824 RepID=A0AAN9MSF5_CANGL